MRVRILNAGEVRQALPMPQAVEAMKRAYAQLSSGEADMPLRSRIGVPSADAVSLFMPAYLPEDGSLAVKIVSVFPGNPKLGLPTVHALVVALDASSGEPLAIFEGGSLTAIRTGAGSGAATDLLARPEAHVAVMIGSGGQAASQLEAVCSVRPIDTILVYSLHQEHAQRFAAEWARQSGFQGEVRTTASANEAVASADVVCTATTAAKPVFDGQRLPGGCHINAVGSYTPEMAEIDLDTLRRAKVVVDSRQAVLEEAGELVQPIRAGAYRAEDIHAELGEIVLGTKPARSDDQEITFFKSVGVAVQDAAAARVALRNAEEMNLGRLVEI